MSLFQEFKKFAMRGNAIDLAVGVVIGAAFSAIVNPWLFDTPMGGNASRLGACNGSRPTTSPEAKRLVRRADRCVSCRGPAVAVKISCRWRGVSFFGADGCCGSRRKSSGR